MHPAPGTPQSHRERLLFWLVLAATLALLVWLSWRARHYQLDDGLIYLRTLSNALDGHGLVFNRGEYFNPLTSPLFTYLMLLVGSAWSDLQSAMIATAAVCTAATVVLLNLHVRRQQGSWLVALGGLFLVASPYVYSTYGMETPLFLLLIAATLYLHGRERYGLAAVAGALLLLTRAEGLFLLLALLVDHLWARRRLPSWRVLVAPAVILAAHLTFNWYYFGEFLPGTGSAKIGQGKSGLWGDQFPLFLHASYLYPMFWGGAWWLLAGTLAAAAVGLAAHARQFRAVVLFLISYAAFFSVLNIPSYHWYYAPLFLFLPYVACVGALTVWRWLRPARSWALGLAAVVVVVPLTYTLLALPPSTRPHEEYRAIGLFLREHTAPSAKVAMVEVGTVGYYSDRYIVDILGLVSPHNAEFIARRQFDKWLEIYQPDYFLVHRPFWPAEAGIQRLIDAGQLLVHPEFDFLDYGLYCPTTTAGCVVPAVPLATDAQYPPVRRLEVHAAAAHAVSADVPGGGINYIRTDGSLVLVAGWVAHRASEPDQQVRVVVPDEPPLAATMTGVERPDVASHYGDVRLRHSGFEIQLRFTAPGHARAAAKRLCVVSASGDGSRKLLSAGNPGCVALFGWDTR